MRSGFATSIVAHLALIGAGFLALPQRAALEIPEVEALPVSLVTLAELTDLSKGRETAPRRDVPSANDPVVSAKVDPTPPPPPEPARAPDPPPPDEAPAAEAAPPAPPDIAAAPPPPTPSPSPAPAPPPTPRAAPAPDKPVAAATPAPVPRARPRTRPDAPPTTRQFTDQITALLDRSTPAASNKSAALGTANGKQAPAELTETETAAINGYLNDRFSKCWTKPPGAVESHQVVEAEIFLKQDGTLARPPTLRPRASGPFAEATVASVRRAIEACVPYRLPPNLYDVWSEIAFTFDPLP